MATDGNPFGDVTKMLEELKMPGIDVQAMAEARRRDVEALQKANMAAYASFQAMAQKQVEMMTQALQTMQQAAAAASTLDPGRQAEVVRIAFQKTLSDMRELAEMARVSQSEAMSVMSKRANEHIQELMQLMQPR